MVLVLKKGVDLVVIGRVALVYRFREGRQSRLRIEVQIVGVINSVKQSLLIVSTKQLVIIYVTQPRGAAVDL